jgi:hypothetical protein
MQDGATKHTANDYVNVQNEMPVHRNVIEDCDLQGFQE